MDETLKYQCTSRNMNRSPNISIIALEKIYKYISAHWDEYSKKSQYVSNFRMAKSPRQVLLSKMYEELIQDGLITHHTEEQIYRRIKNDLCLAKNLRNALKYWEEDKSRPMPKIPHYLIPIVERYKKDIQKRVSIDQIDKIDEGRLIDDIDCAESIAESILLSTKVESEASESPNSSTEPPERKVQIIRSHYRPKSPLLKRLCYPSSDVGSYADVEPPNKQQVVSSPGLGHGDSLDELERQVMLEKHALLMAQRATQEAMLKTEKDRQRMAAEEHNTKMALMREKIAFYRRMNSKSD